MFADEREAIQQSRSQHDCVCKCKSSTACKKFSKSPTESLFEKFKLVFPVAKAPQKKDENELCLYLFAL